MLTLLRAARGLACLTIGVSATVFAAPALQPVVMTESGPVRGAVEGGLEEFLAIPYAAPPIGNLRWKPPQPTMAWSVPRQTGHSPPACPQSETLGYFAAPSTTEDCLYLNIVAPRVEVGDRPKSMPVMVWIHGGGLFSGSASDYDLSALAGRGVIVVAIQYRLGVLGFYENPALGADNRSPNYGMLDQIAALKWVRRNISSFGGDASNVTIFGESGGADSVAMLLASPLASGLFQKAILESSSASVRTVTIPEAGKRSAKLAEVSGCASIDVACLRGLPVGTILQVRNPNLNPHMVGTPELPEPPQVAFSTGRFNHVPVIMGFNRDEFTWSQGVRELLRHAPAKPDDYSDMLSRTYGSGAQAVSNDYPLKNFVNPGRAIAAIMSDSFVICPTRAILAQLSRHVPVYGYEFADRNAPLYMPNVSFPYGAAHTAELQYLFPNFHGATGSQHPLNPDQQALARHMVGLWTQFARNGDPAASDAINWQRYAPQRDNILVLNTGALRQISGTYAQEHHCSFWGRTPVLVQ